MNRHDKRPVLYGSKLNEAGFVLRKRVWGANDAGDIAVNGFTTGRPLRVVVMVRRTFRMVVVSCGAVGFTAPVHKAAAGGLEESAEGALHATLVFTVVMVVAPLLSGRWLARSPICIVRARRAAMDDLRGRRLGTAYLGGLVLRC